MGGFSKEPGEYPDPFHSYLALAALALPTVSSSQFAMALHPTDHPAHTTPDGPMGHQTAKAEPPFGLKELDAAWNVGVDTVEWVREEMERISGRR